MQAFGHFSDGSQDAVWLLALERDNPQNYKNPETLYTLLFYPVKWKVNVFFCWCFAFFYLYLYCKPNMQNYMSSFTSESCTKHRAHCQILLVSFTVSFVIIVLQYLKGSWGKNVLTDMLGVFSFVLKGGRLVACDPTLIRKQVFYKFFWLLFALFCLFVLIGRKFRLKKNWNAC